MCSTAIDRGESAARVHIAFLGCKMQHQVSGFGFIAVTNGLFQTHSCRSVCPVLNRDVRDLDLSWSGTLLWLYRTVQCVLAHELSGSPTVVQQCCDALVVQECVSVRRAVLHTAVVTMCTTWYNIKNFYILPRPTIFVFPAILTASNRSFP
jgi:hypothetical protein